MWDIFYYYLFHFKVNRSVVTLLYKKKTKEKRKVKVEKELFSDLTEIKVNIYEHETKALRIYN